MRLLVAMRANACWIAFVIFFGGRAAREVDQPPHDRELIKRRKQRTPNRICTIYGGIVTPKRIDGRPFVHQAEDREHSRETQTQLPLMNTTKIHSRKRLSDGGVPCPRRAGSASASTAS